MHSHLTSGHDPASSALVASPFINGVSDGPENTENTNTNQNSCQCPATCSLPARFGVVAVAVIVAIYISGCAAVIITELWERLGDIANSRR